MLTEPIMQKIRSRVSVDDITGCWVWQGSRLPKGYGRIRVGAESLYVHRIACEHRNGPPGPKMEAMHSCDNPPCANPDHLSWGASRDNVAQSTARGRRRYLSGEAHHETKLSQREKALMIEAYGLGAKQRDIASLYGVSQATVWRIVSPRSTA